MAETVHNVDLVDQDTNAIIIVALALGHELVLTIVTITIDFVATGLQYDVLATGFDCANSVVITATTVVVEIDLLDLKIAAARIVNNLIDVPTVGQQEQSALSSNDVNDATLNVGAIVNILETTVNFVIDESSLEQITSVSQNSRGGIVGCDSTWGVI
jgi:ABC-type proline/glycine betaine transport system substrate-binding protein